MTRLVNRYRIACLLFGCVALVVTLLVFHSNDTAHAQQPSKTGTDEADVNVSYANFVRVTATPEEVVLDFGFNTQPIGTPEHAPKISQREVVNFYTAKRMLSALQLTVQRHEDAFGPIETDIDKRLRNSQKK